MERLISQIFSTCPQLSSSARLVIAPHRRLHSLSFQTLPISRGAALELRGAFHRRHLRGSEHLSHSKLRRSKTQPCAPSEIVCPQLKLTTCIDKESICESETLCKRISSEEFSSDECRVEYSEVDFKALAEPDEKHWSCARCISDVHTATTSRNACDNQVSAVVECNVLWIHCHGLFASREVATFDLPRLVEDWGLFYDQKTKLLNLRGILRLRLDRCQLAIVTRCSGGAVDTTSKEDECPGVGTAFLLAGARHDICSLWPVLRLSALLVIQRFFEHL
eukprot:Plantae.Rhodophyta-Hildenbrandia_rubra.ctg48383.p1 GENE.Plantae.Rhodophyta-Hildenbrandia_rubra.ctg48383~~Plantae.Rhodophyta-Hildenbrandia_rubra.ctg48383.p1  ORF type:complete len:278 (+),score=8.89 Plantae.Rhodophyta-Hildenbrandia_rubra.ctg48383:281-1114(+)